jgi:hypothetical protein
MDEIDTDIIQSKSVYRTLNDVCINFIQYLSKSVYKTLNDVCIGFIQCLSKSVYRTLNDVCIIQCFVDRLTETLDEIDTDII